MACWRDTKRFIAEFLKILLQCQTAKNSDKMKNSYCPCNVRNLPTKEASSENFLLVFFEDLAPFIIDSRAIKKTLLGKQVSPAGLPVLNLNEQLDWLRNTQLAKKTAITVC